MVRTLFHGSAQAVEHPSFGAGKPFNDYGRAFYCTEHREMAAEWAVGFDHDGFVNEYRLLMDGLNVVDLNAETFTTLHWLTVLLQNRTFDVRAPLAREAKSYLLQHFAVDLSSADVIEGYRADDSYFSFAQDFLSGAISYRQLQRAMQLGDLGRQVAVKSEKAFAQIEFVGAESVLRSDWLARRENRDAQARRRYFDAERNARVRGDLFIQTIIDEQMEQNDARLR